MDDYGTDLVIRKLHDMWLWRRQTKPHQKLQRYWRHTNSKIATTAPDERAVVALEDRYQLRLPEDFREYLLRSCPQADNMDKGGTHWWPVNRIKNIPDEFEHPVQDVAIAREVESYLCFADYMIWCSAWAVNCGSGCDRGRVAFVDGDRDRLVADSFAQFIERYTSDPRQVL